MKIQFDAHQEYQLQAIDAAVSVFEGLKTEYQELETVSLLPQKNGFAFHDLAVKNTCNLVPETVLENIKEIQEKNKITLGIVENEPHFSIEMETGTGKTYVYLRTIHELHKKYGFKKFIIVVPSIAIRQGVLKNLEITEKHFSDLYGAPSLEYFVYDSRKINRLRSFATSNAVQIMVMNIDAFRKSGTVIHKYNDSLGERPIEFIKATSPIVIVDEPQNMESDKAKEALSELNPLCTFRYSATHRNYYNLLYSLNPVEAYDLGLVKQIEVASVREDNSFNDTYIEVVSVERQARYLKAKLKIEVTTREGVKKKVFVVTTQAGKVFDLFDLSSEREQYKGYIVGGISLEEKSVSFTNAQKHYQGQVVGEYADQIIRAQIRSTIHEHFRKEKKLISQGVKVLSLFFLDRVVNYRDYEVADQKGKYAKWFEEFYEEARLLPEYQELNHPSVEHVHAGYFSQDKKGVYKDTRGDSESDNSTYELIMNKKEQLLSLEEPLKFIFSHSALREGWDNPNVFQICTLNETTSEMKKRQEIGRGLRLPVDQTGKRFILGPNILTVIANESYEDFAKKLQIEIEEETGVSFAGRIKKRSSRKTLRLKKAWQDDMNFLALWEHIKHKTRYQVKLEEKELVEKCAKALRESDFRVSKPLIRIERASLDVTKGVFSASLLDQQNFEIKEDVGMEVPDVLSYLSSNSGLTKKTVYEILVASGRLSDVLVNPQQFIDGALIRLNRVLNELIVDGIRYEKIGGEEYEMQLFESQEIEAYLDHLYKVKNQEKTIADYIVWDSEVERDFAVELENYEKVKFFMKLPNWFNIETPLGKYNPDWAIVFEGENKLYFVAETKGREELQDLAYSEKQKIICGQKHFEQIDNVEFVAPVKDLKSFIEQSGVR